MSPQVESGSWWFIVGSAVIKAVAHITFLAAVGIHWAISRVKQGWFPCAIAQIMLELIVLKNCYSFITWQSQITWKTKLPM